MENSLAQFTGLVAAPYTPFTGDRKLNLDTIELQAAHLKQIGVKGAFVCGTTGEGLSLTAEERRAVAERWKEAAREDLLLLVHVGHLCLEDARKLAAHAGMLGADGIATIAPCFYKPATPEALIDWCAAIAAAAPQTPFLYYHIPSFTGVDFPVADLLPQMARLIPNFAGIKFTHSDIADYAETVRRAEGKHALFFGADEVLLDALKVGCVAAVGSTYNYAAPLYLKVMESRESGWMKEAETAQKLASDFVGVLQRYGGLPANKALMSVCGVDCGPVRPPLAPLSEVRLKTMKAELEAIGFFDALNSRGSEEAVACSPGEAETPTPPSV